MIKSIATAAVLGMAACQPAIAQGAVCYDMHEHVKNVVRNQAVPFFVGEANDSGMDFVIYVTPSGKFFAFTESQLTETACLLIGGAEYVSPVGDPA